MSKNHGIAKTLLILLMVLLLSVATLLVWGQGGTGRQNTNVNANKKASTKPKTTARKPAKTTRSTAPTNDNKSKPDESAANERTYWDSIKNSTDPEDFNSYLKRYPNGQYADLARNTLRRLEAAKSSTNPSGANSSLPHTRTNQAGIEFVLIPPGSFMMGSTNGVAINGVAEEKPVHQVTINYSFYMGKYEVTQAQWQSVMGNNPSSFKECANCPVEQVSWDDAQNFINKLNASNDGFRYRLPTEAEWEYACRAGTTGDYAGNLSEMAWYSENSGKKPHAVGGKQPNAWGLADMHGNVWEWCQDWYHETYYGAPTDGSAWLNGGEQKYRVLRGGSWYNGDVAARSAGRYRVAPVNRDAYPFGFRVVAVAQTPTNSSSTTPATVDADPVLFPTDTRNLQYGNPKSPTTGAPATEKVYAGKEVDQRAQIFDKPKPLYTESARMNLISGTVVLKAVLASSGQVTNIRVISGLSNGLTEQAIAAAKKLKFTPAMKDGKAVSQEIQLEYNFSPY